MFVDFFYNSSGLVVALSILGMAIGLGMIGQTIVFKTVPLTCRMANKEVTTYMAATVGIVYAVLLAFIAVAVWEQFGKAENAVAKEASLIGDLYRDTMLMQPAMRGDVPELISEYARILKEEEWPAMAKGDKIDAKGWLILERVGTELVDSAQSDPISIMLTQETFSRLNALYDARRERLSAANDSLEATVWVVVTIGGILSMTFCWIFGCESRPFHYFTTGLVACAFGLVVFLIVSFDRPFRGEVQISTAPVDLVLDNIQRLKSAQR